MVTAESRRQSHLLLERWLYGGSWILLRLSLSLNGSISGQLSVAECTELKLLNVYIALALRSKLLIVSLVLEQLVEVLVIKDLNSLHHKQSNYKTKTNTKKQTKPHIIS